ncbi:aspartate--ammonia ligase [Spirobacillus cienkowskii]|jgi:aspartate--ammonia ligase|uniref:Aspartate--ammonia ligase n=1 Tax=Spirobacillus cienkowskii TaxID=495820 RepID=A0A369KQR7_9BACT|nr:MAG: aspartate--ammonia ligase [Spirobacillus cienkowskii]
MSYLCCFQSEISADLSVDLKKTEKQAEFIKNYFSECLEKKLNLMKISSPLFVESGIGINDDLTGIEPPVKFQIPALSTKKTVEIVQSLAKWKRLMLKRYDFKIGEGLYTDMRAIRPCDKIDATHSAYVDQWDWEICIDEEHRNIDYLKKIVNDIYDSIKLTELKLCNKFSEIKAKLPEKITFIHSEELLGMYPNLSPIEREREICKIHGAVFLIGIGAPLSNGKPHGTRAPDYDDWSTPSEFDFKGLNGDILLWNSKLECAFELSSMGIRVNAEALQKQLQLTRQQIRSVLYFHTELLSERLPSAIGGGIGQSRLVMLLLDKLHISEVQASVFKL